MANTITMMRTSYFKVKDESAFKNELNSLDNFNAEFGTSENHPGKLCIFGEDFSFVQKEVFDEEGDYVDDIDVDVFEMIQSHLKDDEAVLVNSIAWEKFRFVDGNSAIITPIGVAYLNADQAVRDLAVEKGLLSKDAAAKLDCTY